MSMCMTMYLPPRRPLRSVIPTIALTIVRVGTTLIARFVDSARGVVYAAHYTASARFSPNRP
jgi:hypothetical protein